MSIHISKIKAHLLIKNSVRKVNIKILTVTSQKRKKNQVNLGVPSV